MKQLQIGRFARAFGIGSNSSSAPANAPASTDGPPLLAATQFGGAQCRYEVVMTGTAGPNAAPLTGGVLSFGVGEDGAISTGSLEFPDGSRSNVVGQARGGALRALVEGEKGELIAFIGNSEQDISDCPPTLIGPYGGPDLDDIGTWRGEALGPA